MPFSTFATTTTILRRDGTPEGDERIWRAVRTSWAGDMSACYRDTIDKSSNGFAEHVNEWAGGRVTYAWKLSDEFPLVALPKPGMYPELLTEDELRATFRHVRHFPFARYGLAFVSDISDPAFDNLYVRRPVYAELWDGTARSGAIIQALLGHDRARLDGEGDGLTLTVTTDKGDVLVPKHHFVFNRHGFKPCVMAYPNFHNRYSIDSDDGTPILYRVKRTGELAVAFRVNEAGLDKLRVAFNSDEVRVTVSEDGHFGEWSSPGFMSVMGAEVRSTVPGRRQTLYAMRGEWLVRFTNGRFVAHPQDVFEHVFELVPGQGA